MHALRTSSPCGDSLQLQILRTMVIRHTRLTSGPNLKHAPHCQKASQHALPFRPAFAVFEKELRTSEDMELGLVDLMGKDGQGSCLQKNPDENGPNEVPNLSELFEGKLQVVHNVTLESCIQRLACLMYGIPSKPSLRPRQLAPSILHLLFVSWADLGRLASQCPRRQDEAFASTGYRGLGAASRPSLGRACSSWSHMPRWNGHPLPLRRVEGLCQLLRFLEGTDSTSSFSSRHLGSVTQSSSRILFVTVLAALLLEDVEFWI